MLQLILFRSELIERIGDGANTLTQELKKREGRETHNNRTIGIKRMDSSNFLR